MTRDSRFPLGKPINRKQPAPALRPCPTGHKNWFVDRNGKRVYIEPEKKTYESRVHPGTA